MYAELYQPFLGRKSKRVCHTIEAGAVRHFAEAVREQDPVYFDEEYAEKTPYGGIIAPPTFVITMGFPPITGVWFPEHVVHVASKLRFSRPLRAGEKVWLQDTLADVYEKEGKRSGPMIFFVKRHRVFDETGTLCLVSDAVTMIRKEEMDRQFPGQIELPEEVFAEKSERERRTRCFGEFHVGQELPEVKRPAYTCEDVARYAGASGDYNPIHIEDEAAVKAGFRSRLVHGMTHIAYLAGVFKEWFGDDAYVSGMDIRFGQPAYPGDQPVFHGVIQDQDREKNAFTVEVDVRTQEGTSILAGTGTVTIPES